MALAIVPVVSNFKSEVPSVCVMVALPAAAVLPITSVPVFSVVPPE